MAKAVPEGLHTVTPQLSVDGATQAIDFYKKAFGAEEVMRAPDPSGQKIWHAQLRIGNSSIFVNDTFPEMGGKPSQSSMWLYLDNVDAAFKRAVDAGCTVRMAVADMFWGDRTGTVTDRWGIQWTIATHVKDMSPAEMKKAEAEFIKNMPKK
jgi:PhnB protein